jgi:hypothetical protein
MYYSQIPGSYPEACSTSAVLYEYRGILHNGVYHRHRIVRAEGVRYINVLQFDVDALQVQIDELRSLSSRGAKARRSS